LVMKILSIPAYTTRIPRKWCTHFGYQWNFVRVKKQIIGDRNRTAIYRAMAEQDDEYPSGPVEVVVAFSTHYLLHGSRANCHPYLAHIMITTIHTPSFCTTSVLFTRPGPQGSSGMNCLLLYCRKGQPS
jgi:hypothetical protein